MVPSDQFIARHLKLRSLHILAVVMRSRGINKAASILNMSQPAVSKAITELEATVGQRLFDRGPKGVEPTPFGQELVQRAAVVFDELRAGINEFEFLSDPAAGDIHIGAPALASGFVAKTINSLSRNYPRINYRLSLFNTKEAYRALEQRQVDFVFMHVIESISSDLTNLEILFHDPQVVAVAGNSKYLRRRKLKLGDLMNEPWALPSPDTPMGSVVAEAFASHGLETPTSSIIAPLSLRYPLLASGRFVTILPRIALEAFRLRALPIDLPATRRPFGVVLLKNRTVNSAAQLFIAQAREIASDLKYMV